MQMEGMNFQTRSNN
ncbi:hypothetical protein [Enterocloster sp.]